MIYFLHAPELGRIKIGTAGDVEARLMRIRDGAPLALNLLATCPGDRNIEHKLHKHFAAFRVYREWFVENESLSTLIDTLSGLGEHEQRNLLDGLLIDRTVRLAFDKPQERSAFSDCLLFWIKIHGSKRFCEVARLSPEMETAVRLRGSIIGALPFSRLLAVDPIPFIGFWPFTDDQLRRLRREIDAQICAIEARRDAA